MMEYKTLYALYEDSIEMHQNTIDTERTEQELDKFLHSLDTETMFRFDALAGKLARAYEMQGFLFGLNCAQTKVVLEKPR